MRNVHLENGEGDVKKPLKLVLGGLNYFSKMSTGGLCFICVDTYFAVCDSSVTLFPFMTFHLVRLFEPLINVIVMMKWTNICFRKSPTQ